MLVIASGMAIRFKEDDVRPMGLVAAGVNGIKLEDKDEVVGMEVLPAEGEIFLLASDGKAKRVDEKEFPKQGRYGKGVVAWDLPNKVTLTAVASGKPNHVATIHMSKGAAKSARLDLAAVRKRSSTKGELVVEVKPVKRSPPCSGLDGGKVYDIILERKGVYERSEVWKKASPAKGKVVREKAAPQTKSAPKKR